MVVAGALFVYGTYGEIASVRNRFMSNLPIDRWPVSVPLWLASFAVLQDVTDAWPFSPNMFTILWILVGMGLPLLIVARWMVTGRWRFGPGPSA